MQNLYLDRCASKFVTKIKVSYMWSFWKKKILVLETLVPYVKCHENVSFLKEIIEVQRSNTIFDNCALLKQHRFTS